MELSPMQKEIARKTAAYDRSVNPDYIARKLVKGYTKIIGSHFRSEAKKCASKAVDEILKAIQSTMDVRMTARSAQDRENIKKYMEVKSRIKNL